MQSHPTWVRGLKHIAESTITLKTKVAPYVGAWIETIKAVKNTATIMSHPTWVRGLKLLQLHLRLVCLVSHPTWVRGLKHK